jgi:hypothetical protein
LETARSGLSGKQQAAIEYGVGALTGGVTRFVFGREVVDAAKAAFAEAPSEFPDHLAVPVKVKAEEEEDGPNRALVALEDAAKATGTWMSGAAGSATRPFRRVDLDGDGVPDEPQALTAVKGVGGAIAGAAGTVAKGATSLFKRKKQGKIADSEPQREIEAADAPGDE